MRLIKASFLALFFSVLIFASLVYSDENFPPGIKPFKIAGQTPLSSGNNWINKNNLENNLFTITATELNSGDSGIVGIAPKLYKIKYFNSIPAWYDYWSDKGQWTAVSATATEIPKDNYKKFYGPTYNPPNYPITTVNEYTFKPGSSVSAGLIDGDTLYLKVYVFDNSKDTFLTSPLPGFKGNYAYSPSQTTDYILKYDSTPPTIARTGTEQAATDGNLYLSKDELTSELTFEIKDALSGIDTSKIFAHFTIPNKSTSVSLSLLKDISGKYKTKEDLYSLLLPYEGDKGELTIIAYDVAGNKNQLSLPIIVLDPPPAITITNDPSKTYYTSADITAGFSGIVDAFNNNTTIYCSLYNFSEKKYWSGTGWSGSAVKLPVNLISAKNQPISWSYVGLSSGSFNKKDICRFQVWAENAVTGNKTDPLSNTRIFTYDNSPPPVPANFSISKNSKNSLPLDSKDPDIIAPFSWQRTKINPYYYFTKPASTPLTPIVSYTLVGSWFANWEAFVKQLGLSAVTASMTINENSFNASLGGYQIFPNLALSDGLYWANLLSTNSSNLTTVACSQLFGVDTIAPTTTVLKNPVLSSAGVRLEWSSSTDTTSGMLGYRINLKNKDLGISMPLLLTPETHAITIPPVLISPEANYECFLEAFDLATNVATSAVSSFKISTQDYYTKIDTEIPTLALSGPADNSTLTDGSVNFSWTGQRKSKDYVFPNGYDLYINSTKVNTSSPYYTYGLANGTYSWYVEGSFYGTKVSTSPRTLTVNQTFSLTAPADKSESTTSSVNFSWGTSANWTSYDFYVDDKLVKNFSGGTTASSLSDGLHTWYVAAKDSAGKVSVTSSTWSFTVNSGGPQITVKTAKENLKDNLIISAKEKLSIEVKDDNLVDQSSVKVLIDNAEVKATVLSIQDTGGKAVSLSSDLSLSEGYHTIRVTAKDKLGKESSVSYIGIKTYSGKARLLAKPMNYPNPFKPSSGQGTTIYYNLSDNADIKIMIFDLAGRMVWQNTYASGENGGKAGENTPTWDGKSSAGQIQGNGAYLYTIVSEGKLLDRGEMAINE